VPRNHVQPAAGQTTRSHRHTHPRAGGSQLTPRLRQWAWTLWLLQQPTQYLQSLASWMPSAPCPTLGAVTETASNTQPCTQDRAPHPGKWLETGSSERPGQTALVTHRARPDRCTDQPLLAHDRLLLSPHPAVFPLAPPQTTLVLPFPILPRTSHTKSCAILKRPSPAPHPPDSDYPSICGVMGGISSCWLMTMGVLQPIG